MNIERTIAEIEEQIEKCKELNCKSVALGLMLALQIIKRHRNCDN